MLIFWIIFFEIAVLYFASSTLLRCRIATPKVAWLAFALMLIGSVVNNIAVFRGASSVMMTSYVPMMAEPNFYLGLILFAVGALEEIDHVVAVSDAWQKGAQQISSKARYSFYNDPLNLLAVDGPTNSAKGDGDAATWLPPNKSYRCAYVARQVAVKAKYKLWVTSAEKTAIQGILAKCPKQPVPSA